MKNQFFKILFEKQDICQKQKQIITLIDSRYKCQVINNILQVELTQRFQNQSEEISQGNNEAIYSIPTNQNICLESFQATINGQTIKGYVKGKKESTQLYEKGKSDGNIVGYCEKKQFEDGNTDSLHIKIGNIPQNVFVDIKLIFSQQLSCLLNTFYYVDLDLIFQDQKSKDIDPLFQLLLSCSSKITYYYSFGIETNISNIDDNNIHIQSIISNKVNTELSQEKFRLIFQFEGMYEPQVLYGKCENQVSLAHNNTQKQIEVLNHSVLLSFIPNFNKKFQIPITDAIKASLQSGQNILSEEYILSFNESIIDQFESSKSEFIFLIDRSGSMSGSSIQKAKESLILFIKSLPQNSYFNVVSFGSTYSFMFQNSEKYSDQIVNYSVKTIEKYTADMGGTDIYKPLSQIFSNIPRIDRYGRQIYLLTDGEVESKNNVLKLIRNNSIGNRVHSIGIGSSVDKNLIIQSAKVGRGCHKLVDSLNNLHESVIYLLQNSISPILESFQIIYNTEIFTSQYPDLFTLNCIFKDDLFNLSLFLKPGLDIDDLKDEDKKIKISFFDTSCNQQFEKIILLEPQDAHRYDPNLSRSVFKIGMHLKLNQIGNEDYNKIQEIVQHSIEHQILTEYTSYFCEIEKINDEKRIEYWMPAPQQPQQNKQVQVQSGNRTKQTARTQIKKGGRSKQTARLSTGGRDQSSIVNIQKQSIILESSRDPIPIQLYLKKKCKLNFWLKKYLNNIQNIGYDENGQKNYKEYDLDCDEDDENYDVESENCDEDDEDECEYEVEYCDKLNMNAKMNSLSKSKVKYEEKQLMKAAKEIQGESNKKDKDSNKQLGLQEIINSVDIQGMWSYKEDIVKTYTNSNQTNINDTLKEFKSKDLFMTFLIMWILENHFIKQKSQWILIFKKSTKFIEKQVPDQKKVLQLKEIINNLLSNA